MAHEEGKFRHSQTGRIDACHGESAKFARVLHGPRRGRDYHVFEIRRGRFKLAGGELRFRLGAVVESRGGDASGDARAQNRADERGDRVSIRV